MALSAPIIRGDVANCRDIALGDDFVMHTLCSFGKCLGDVMVALISLFGFC